MIIYGAIIAGVIIAALSGAVWMQTERLDVAHDQIENCEKEKEILGKSVIRQNRAVKGWEDTAAERQRQAKAALLAAGKGNVSKDAEIARLKALNAAGLTCSGAVSEVRKGLRK